MIKSRKGQHAIGSRPVGNRITGTLVAIAVLWAATVALADSVRADGIGQELGLLEKAIAEMHDTGQPVLSSTDSELPSWDSMIGAIAASKRCVVSAEQLSKNGIPPTARVTIPTSMTEIDHYEKAVLASSSDPGNLGWLATAPLRDIARYCQRYHRSAYTALVRPYLEHYAERIAHHTERLQQAMGDVDPSYHLLLRLNYDSCIQAVAQAIEKGAPVDAAIQLRKAKTGLAADKTVTLGTAQREICDPLKAIIARARTADAGDPDATGQADTGQVDTGQVDTGQVDARQADDRRDVLARFARAFGGENTGRYKALAAYKLARLRIYGPGRKLLRTPGDFARAPRWYQVRRNSRNNRRWKMRVFTFRGTRYTVKTRTGKGARQLRRAFR
ncbi:MAG: hypothetical protein MJE77_13445 [Proteobacteria bacterium]|nr:hypothetical protein [Pseudomonadota bacterium]